MTRTKPSQCESMEVGELESVRQKSSTPSNLELCRALNRVQRYAVLCYNALKLQELQPLSDAGPR